MKFFLPPGGSLSWTKVQNYARGLSQCWTESRFKEVIQVLAVNQAGISRLLDMVKAIANSDVYIEENE